MARATSASIRSPSCWDYPSILPGRDVRAATYPARKRIFIAAAPSWAAHFLRRTARSIRTAVRRKLGAITDDNPMKLSVEVSASVHRDLVAHGQVLARQTDQDAVEPARLVAPRLCRKVSFPLRLPNDNPLNITRLLVSTSAITRTLRQNLYPCPWAGTHHDPRRGASV